ncbi:flavonol reductase/cinnamoyl-CoA reductase family protein [Schizosaccharomyces cryophilus OY26]|uniref:Flavonol reductase/cinnamoyl-CoA reductase family protein n=1 Tax=Schizosaccharomyces cryophilus (strain OY26 / ATCC MYA-4695 / CBS 11777 / NBRC 106824 / NRRL Y48691) TaxID=653667 RepID=S9XHX6_SCHCR|nr:flavonol reductase/cinnamoyl-CoA reductase family protein [Schizosaccharomyces cryophilus OY26]EPY53291.1 flavonol reductase/cinnamoyl-CoA reductase family protein [Schizosaccharomyces cryophilus OY26]
MSNQQLVLVTGVTGFIGAHVAVSLLNKGYRVRGTVRTMDKANELVRLNPELKDKIEFVIVKDIMAPYAFKDVIKDCDYVCHIASPFIVENITNNKDQLLDPAVNGTLSALEAAVTEPKVKRVVITSSFAAIGNFTVDPSNGYTYTEKDWNPITYDEAVSANNGIVAYCASKKLAEKAAREWVKEKQPHFDISTVNPPYVFGPPIHPMNSMDSLNTSNQILWTVINGSKVQPSIQHVEVDVRDVANAHVLALESPHLSNGRLLVSCGPFSTNSISKVLRDRFPEKKDVISEPSDVPFNEKHYTLDNSLSKSLGLKYYSEEQTYIDTAAKLWERAEQFAKAKLY